MKMAKLIFAIIFILCMQTVYTSGKKKGLKKRLTIVEDRQNNLSTTHREDINEVKMSVDELKTYFDSAVETSVGELKMYVDSSIKALKDEILRALCDSVTSCSENVAWTTAPPNQTSTLAITEAPHQTTTLATTQVPGQTTIPTSTSQVQSPSCLELYHNGERQSGVYTIYPLPSNQPVQVYCDMDTDGGGWTVFQRRQDGSVDFFRTWDEYAVGFGNVSGEFWLGNDLISSLTNDGFHELRIDMEDFHGKYIYVTYSQFRVSSSDGNYSLTAGGYAGDAGDELTFLSGMAFSSRDQDNDISSTGNCAQEFSGSWWYSSCGLSNLNGLYGHGHKWEGVWWHWKSGTAPLQWTEMKLRAKPQA